MARRASEPGAIGSECVVCEDADESRGRDERKLLPPEGCHHEEQAQVTDIPSRDQKQATVRTWGKETGSGAGISMGRVSLAVGYKHALCR
jgi:hypothetical protein